MRLSELFPAPNGAELAYLGDAVLELLVRERILLSGRRDLGKMNREALEYVKATAQSLAFARIEELLTEDEAAVFRRGRNSHGISIPKSASAAEYRRATGFEALFAYLYLSGDETRMRSLFDTAYPKEREQADKSATEENYE